MIKIIFYMQESGNFRLRQALRDHVRSIGSVEK